MEGTEKKSGQPAADQPAPICSYKGFARELLKRTLEKLDRLDEQGIPSWNQVAKCGFESFIETRDEVNKTCG